MYSRIGFNFIEAFDLYLMQNLPTTFYDFAILSRDRSDLVVIDESLVPSRVYLLEMTCMWDSGTSFQSAMDRKKERYERLALDIKEKGYSSSTGPLRSESGDV